MYRATLVDAVQRGVVQECWIQGVVAGSRISPTSSSFVLDDGTGAIECFSSGCSRGSLFTVNGSPCAVIREATSKSALDLLIGLPTGQSPGATPASGAYVAVWGFVFCLLEPQTLVPTFRLLVMRWASLPRDGAEAHWLQTNLPP